MPDTGSGDFVLNLKGGADDDHRGVSAWAFDLGAGLRVRSRPGLRRAARGLPDCHRQFRLNPSASIGAVSSD